jgi:hypothetical protein
MLSAAVSRTSTGENLAPAGGKQKAGHYLFIPPRKLCSYVRNVVTDPLRKCTAQTSSCRSFKIWHGIC